MQVIARNASGQTKAVNLIEPPLGRGGEGSVYKVAGMPAAVAKIYHDKGDKFREAKVSAMIAHPVNSDAYAWPRVTLYTTDTREFAGYIMPVLESNKFQPWFSLANKAERMKVCPQFSFKYALNACANLLIALSDLHAEGCYVGDLNESGTFVSKSSQIYLIDNDSFAIKDHANGRTLRCLVGKPEYTAPSLQGVRFAEIDRNANTDLFAAMVLMFQMLSGGSHPCDGVCLSDDHTEIATRIKRRQFPALEATSGYKMSQRTQASTAIPRLLVRMFTELAKETGALTTDKCLAVISDVQKHLKPCAKESRHFYDERDHQQCPWCNLPFDPWGKQISRPRKQQSSLPELRFNDSDDGPKITRVPTKTSSSGITAHARSPRRPPVTPAAPAQPATPPPSPAPSTPQISIGYNRKSRGSRRNVVTYGNGVSAVRPPLTLLFRSNPRLAWECLIDETPPVMRFTWGDIYERGAMRKYMSVIGLLITTISILLINYGLRDILLNNVILPSVSSWSVTSISTLQSAYNAILGIGFFGAFIVAIVVCATGSIKTMGYKRRIGRPVKPDEYEPAWKTAANFALVPVLYGPFLLVGGAIVIMVKIISTAISSYSPR